MGGDVLPHDDPRDVAPGRATTIVIWHIYLPWLDLDTGGEVAAEIAVVILPVTTIARPASLHVGRVVTVHDCVGGTMWQPHTRTIATSYHLHA